MVYEMDVNRWCSPEVGPIIEQFRDQGTEQALSKIGQLFETKDGFLPSVVCMRAMIGELAAKVPSTAVTNYMSFLLGRMWGVWVELAEHPEGSGLLDPEYVATLVGVYQRVPYHPGEESSSYPNLYFSFGRVSDTDLRQVVVEHPVWHMPIGSEWAMSETWAQLVYLASFDEPEALEHLGSELHTVEDPNDLFSMLVELIDYPVVSSGMKTIVASFADDPRPTDNGIDGVPTIALGVEARRLLDRT